MKINYKCNIIFILFLLCHVKYTRAIKFCCCIYKKDPFRGFEKSSAELCTLDKQEALEKDEIGNKILKICTSKNGLPTYENIQRIKRDNYDIDKIQCEKECSYLIIEMNDKFEVDQEEKRIEYANELRDKRKRLASILDSKISQHVNSLYKGEKCKSDSNKIKNKNFERVSNGCKKTVFNIQNKFKMGNNSNSGLDDFSFLSLSDESDGCIGIERDTENIISSDSHLKADDVDSNLISILSDQHINDDTDIPAGSIKEEIHILDNQILYLEMKNKRPRNFIMNRFSIPDEILIMMLKIFETTLDETVRSLRNYFEDTIYFQFRIAYKINKSSIYKNHII